MREKGVMWMWRNSFGSSSLKKNLNDEPRVSILEELQRPNFQRLQGAYFPSETVLIADMSVNTLTYVAQIIETKTNPWAVAEACGIKRPLHLFWIWHSLLPNLVVCANPINSPDRLLIPDIILLVLSLLSRVYLAANQLNKQLLFVFFNNIASDLHRFCAFTSAFSGFVLIVIERL